MHAVFDGEFLTVFLSCIPSLLTVYAELHTLPDTTYAVDMGLYHSDIEFITTVLGDSG